MRRRTNPPNLRPSPALIFWLAVAGYLMIVLPKLAF